MVIVSTGKGGAHLRPVKKTMATATRVEDAELDGDVRNRLRRDSSSDSQRRLAPRWSNAAALLASSTSPAWRASTNQSEREGERLSGR
jgi:hypothetical protein